MFSLSLLCLLSYHCSVFGYNIFMVYKHIICSYANFLPVLYVQFIGAKFVCSQFICKLHSLPPAEKDLVNIAEYLSEIGKAEILKLGLVLGLTHNKLKANMNSDTYLYDVIAAWLRKEDYVEEMGEPSWTTLVNALKHPTVKQEGIANKIAQEKLQ